MVTHRLGEMDSDTLLSDPTTGPSAVTQFTTERMEQEEYHALQTKTPPPSPPLETHTDLHECHTPDGVRCDGGHWYFAGWVTAGDCTCWCHQ